MSRSAATKPVSGAGAVALMWRLDGECRAVKRSVKTILPDPGPSRCFPGVLSASYFGSLTFHNSGLMLLIVFNT